jgi:DNA-binding response OmpR family regulator
MKSHSSAELQSAPTGVLGARMIVGGDFAIALIDATLPDTSGIELAKLAANQNIPVLMLSENPPISQELRRLDFQFLEKPFDLNLLLATSRRVMLEHAAHLKQIKPDAAFAAPNLEALRAEVAEAHQQFDAIVKHLGYLKL